MPKSQGAFCRLENQQYNTRGSVWLTSEQLVILGTVVSADATAVLRNIFTGTFPGQ